MGEAASVPDRVIGLVSDDDDQLFVLWALGARLLVGRMAGAVVRAIKRKNCMRLHWRDGMDNTIQKADFPLAVD
jgi:hypothetical protein